MTTLIEKIEAALDGITENGEWSASFSDDMPQVDTKTVHKFSGVPELIASVDAPEDASFHGAFHKHYARKLTER